MPSPVQGEPALGIRGKNVVFSDVLVFFTSLSAGVNPTLTLSTIPGELRLINASLLASAERDDRHSVIVALATDPDKKADPDVGPLSARRAMVARAGRQRVVESGVLRESRVVTALVQRDEPARNRVLIELQRLRDLEDDDNEAPKVLGERFLEVLRLP